MYAFNGIESNIDLTSDDNIYSLPKGNYLTLIYSSDNMDYCESLMMNYLKEHNLKAKQWLEVELFNNIFETGNYNCQIQVLIE